MYHFMFHKVKVLDECDSLKKKMQAVRYNSAPSVSLLHACYQNTNTLKNTKEHWVHGNSVNQLLRCKQACGCRVKPSKEEPRVI